MQVPKRIRWDDRTQTYRTETGSIATPDQIQAWIDGEQEKTRQKLRRLARSYALGKLTLGVWKRQHLSEVMAAQQRVMVAAFGSLSPTVVGLLGEQRGIQGAYLDRFAGAVGDGEFQADTPTAIGTKIGYRSELYANTLRMAFSAAELEAKKQAGGWVGWRKTDIGAISCKQCPQYETGGWVTLDRIAPIGYRCQCQNNCRCRILYKRLRSG